MRAQLTQNESKIAKNYHFGPTFLISKWKGVLINYLQIEICFDYCLISVFPTHFFITVFTTTKKS